MSVERERVEERSCSVGPHATQAVAEGQTPHALIALQRSAGNQAVARLIAAQTALLQRAPKEPGERIEFRHNKKDYSGLVIRIKTPSKSEDRIVYEVDANIDGSPTSITVKNGKLLSVDMPDAPDVDDEIDQILGLDVRIVTQKLIDDLLADQGIVLRAAAGDVLVGTGVLIKRPPTAVTDTVAAASAKGTFLKDVVRDLTIISRTKSGQGLLASIESQARQTLIKDPKKGVQTLIQFVDGFENRSAADPTEGLSGEWLAGDGFQRADSGESAKVGYNPSISGLAIRADAHLSDDLIFPALEAGFGRPKEKPSDVTLFHEMIHAEDMMHGRIHTAETPLGGAKAKVSEMHAVGLGEYRDEDFIAGESDRPEIYSENTYRHERGVAQRPWYGDEAENDDAPGDLSKPGLDTPRRPMEAVPAPYSGIDKAFTRKGKINQRAQDIAGATGRNKTRTDENALIAMSENRTKLLADVKRTNQAAFDLLVPVEL